MPKEKSPMSFPPGWSNDPLSEHMDKAIHKVPATFDLIQHQYAFLAGIDHRFSVIYTNLSDDDLSAICSGWPNPWNDLQHSQALWPKIFMIRAHSGYRAACQLAMSGQFTESVPILRLCLEHSLYALHMNKNEAALDAWNRQYGGYSPLKPISRIFSMRKLKRTIKETDKEVKIELLPFIEKLYQLTIEFGGHPNKWAIDLNLEIAPIREKSKVKLMHDDQEFIEASMVFSFKLGLVCLLVFKRIFPQCFEEQEINPSIEEFEKDLPRQLQIIEKFLSG